jgi:Zn-dependent protease with chaperone function
MIACVNCQMQLAADARFCIHCGMAQMSQMDQGYGFPYGFGCQTCGGDGSRLPSDRVYCATCRWLRPLGPGYSIGIDAFLWALDADAMNLLRSMGPLTAAAHAVSERVGRPWLEASVNGLRLSEKQLPEIFNTAIRAARILSLTHLPELYISGDQMWDAMTLGTDSSAFIVLGSVLTNFKGDDLLFVLGREMGHCRAGHALWKTVMQFLSGRSRHRSIMGDGILHMLNPAKIVEGAIDAPLMAWSRHADITADRAGLLAVGKEEVARRVLMTWTLKSFPLQARINPEAWAEQEAVSEDTMSRVSEWTLSSTPYLAGRLRTMREFAASDGVKGWRAVIEHWLPPEPAPAPEPPKQAAGAPAAPSPATSSAPAQAPDPNTVRLVCPSCKEGMRIPKAALESGETVNVRCPNPKCKSVLTVTPKKPAPPPAPATQPAAPPPSQDALTDTAAAATSPA